MLPNEAYNPFLKAGTEPTPPPCSLNILPLSLNGTKKSPLSMDPLGGGGGDQFACISYLES